MPIVPRTLLVAVAALLCAAFSVAQDANPYNGTWRAEFQTEQGAPREGTVTIQDQGGTWDMMVRTKNNPCVGRAVPIRVQKATADELVFLIARSQSLAGCSDGTATLKPVDANTLQGEFEERRKLKLVRK